MKRGISERGRFSASYRGTKRWKNERSRNEIAQPLPAPGSGVDSVSSSSRFHAGVEESHERIETILIGAHDEAAHRVGKQRLPRRFALLHPDGVGGPLGRAAFQ